MKDSEIISIVKAWFTDYKGLVETLKEYWMMDDGEVLAEILKLGAKNEVAILDMMSIDRMANERGE